MYGGPRNPAYFNDPSFREATRLIRLDLQLTSPDKLKFRGLMDTGYDAADADGESESVASTSDILSIPLRNLNSRALTLLVGRSIR